MKRVAAVTTAAAALALAGPASSHHSFAMFDRDHPIKIAGTIKEFQWVNPHTWIQILVPGPGGKVTEWGLEGRSPNILARRDWTRKTLKPGDKVTLTIFPLKSGQPGGAIELVEFEDGRTLYADTPAAVDTNEENRK